MAKTYKKISGVWQPIKKVWKNIGGDWYKAKKIYKKISGTWQIVHNGAVEYTFDSSVTATATTGILLSSYVDPTSADEFIITVNSGVVLSGKAGATGGTGAAGSLSTNRGNCHGNGSGYGGNGGTGGNGGNGIDFTGFSDKKITLINNGTIKGGDGGTGGKGGNAEGNAYCDSQCATHTTLYGGCGGSGGAGASWDYNSSGITFVYSGNSAINTSTGATGAGGSNAIYSHCPGSN